MVTVLRTSGSLRRSTVDSDSEETSGTPGSGSIGAPLTPPETTPRSTRPIASCQFDEWPLGCASAAKEALERLSTRSARARVVGDPRGREEPRRRKRVDRAYQTLWRALRDIAKKHPNAVDG